MNISSNSAERVRGIPKRLIHITTVPVSLTFLRGQVGYMRERNLEVHALSSPGAELDAFGEYHGVPTYAVEMPRRITPVHDIRAVYEIFRVIRCVRPEIVHAHTPKGGLLGMIAAALARVPVRIYHMRGLPLAGATGAKRVLLSSTERFACRLAHRVICVSHSLREVAIAQRLCSPDKLTVLAGGSGQGVDATARFNPDGLEKAAREITRTRYGIPSDALVIGFVGRLVRDKGIVELEAAWRSLREMHPNLHLLMVGPWEQRDPVPANVRTRLEADPRVHLAGSQRDMPRHYAAMDVVVLPTYREGFPNVPLEAAAMAKPVVTTRIPGCVDAVVDGITGTLVPPREVELLAAALGRYLGDAALRRVHGETARERVLRDFRPAVIAEAMYGEYMKLLTRRRQKDLEHRSKFNAPRKVR